MRLLTALYARFAHLVHELAKFGTIGAVAAVIDIGGSNLLWHLGVGALTGKVLATVAATSFAFLGNRFWTFRHRENSGLAREYFLFFVLNGIGLLIAVLCLGFTVYTLELDGPLARNISANVIGLALGTAFRFWSYKRWVFLPPEAVPVDPHTGLPMGSAHDAHGDHDTAAGRDPIAGGRVPWGSSTWKAAGEVDRGHPPEPTNGHRFSDLRRGH